MTKAKVLQQINLGIKIECKVRETYSMQSGNPLGIKGRHP
jgi:hypothetical protein